MKIIPVKIVIDRSRVEQLAFHVEQLASLEQQDLLLRLVLLVVHEQQCVCWFH